MTPASKAYALSVTLDDFLKKTRTQLLTEAFEAGRAEGLREAAEIAAKEMGKCACQMIAIETCESCLKAAEDEK